MHYSGLFTSDVERECKICKSIVRNNIVWNGISQSEPWQSIDGIILIDNKSFIHQKIHEKYTQKHFHHSKFVHFLLTHTLKWD